MNDTIIRPEIVYTTKRPHEVTSLHECPLGGRRLALVWGERAGYRPWRTGLTSSQEARPRGRLRRS